MKYALVNDEKVEATKGSTGICPLCGSIVIAKCGICKINHWAHKSNPDCDAWAEKETPWHRNWKNKFPCEWQERVFTDENSGEKHIADICTDNNLVIEFQHSSIKPEEKSSREKFYKNMLWVVDGTRLKRDYSNFKYRNCQRISKTVKPAILLCSNPTDVLPKKWQHSKVPILLDFLGDDESVQQDYDRQDLFCILPCIVDNNAIIVQMTRDFFIHKASDNSILNYLDNAVNIGFDYCEKYKNIQLQRLVRTSLMQRSSFKSPRL